MHTTHFHDLSHTAAAFIGEAQRSLHIAMCWFTHLGLYQALEQRLRAGVQVSLMLNFDQVNFQPRGLDFFALQQAGGDVWGFTGPELLHHKFAVADCSRVLSGSWNWTRASHRDHLVFSDDAAVAGAFCAEFEALKDRAQPLSTLHKAAPRTVFFQQLHQPVCWSADDIRRRILNGARVWIAPFPTHAGDLWARCLREQSHIFSCKGILKSFWTGRLLWDEAAFANWMHAVKPLRGLRQAALYCRRLRIGDVLVAVRPSGVVLGAGIVGSEPEPCPSSPGDVRRYVPWLALPEEKAFADPAIKAPCRTLKRYPASGLQLVEQIRAAAECAQKT